MITNIFPTKIYKVKFTENLSTFKEKVMPILEEAFKKTLKDNQKSMRGGLCSFNTVRDLHKLPEFQSYVDFVNQHLPIYWKELGYGGRPHITQMWANIYPPGSFIESHNHSPTNATINFYLQKSSRSGNIVFEHPTETLLRHQPFTEESYKMFNYEVDAEEGDIVMFPGYLQHKSLPNRDVVDRIIIGTNVHSLG
jgi:uncharacterized protein (TIGR02466 family)